MKMFILGSLFASVALTATLSASAAPAAPKDAVYVAKLQAVNVKASGQPASGEVRFTIHGDQLTIKVHVQGVPPGIEHWQHFHGFPDGKQATCPGAAADANGDGYIDML